jgi:hypothetical protein
VADDRHPRPHLKKRPGILQEQKADAEARVKDRPARERGHPVRVRGFKKGKKD